MRANLLQSYATSGALLGGGSVEKDSRSATREDGAFKSKIQDHLDTSTSLSRFKAGEQSVKIEEQRKNLAKIRRAKNYMVSSLANVAPETSKFS